MPKGRNVLLKRKGRIEKYEKYEKIEFGEF